MRQLMSRRVLILTAVPLILAQVGCAARAGRVPPTSIPASISQRDREVCAEFAQRSASTVKGKPVVGGVATGFAEGLVGIQFFVIGILLAPVGAIAGGIETARANSAGREQTYDAAEETCVKPLIVMQTLGPEHPDVAVALRHLAMGYAAQDDYAKAEPLYQRALAIQEKTLGSEHEDVIRTLEAYAAVMRKMGQDTEAGSLAQRALAAREANAEKGADTVVRQTLDEEGPARVILRLDGLGDMARDLEAEAFYRRALAIADEAPETDAAVLLSVLQHYGNLLCRTNRRAAALALEARAQAIKAQADQSARGDAAIECVEGPVSPSVSGAESTTQPKEKAARPEWNPGGSPNATWGWADRVTRP